MKLLCLVCLLFLALAAGAQPNWVRSSGDWKLTAGSLSCDDPGKRGALVGLPGQAYRDFIAEVTIRFQADHVGGGEGWAGLLVRGRNPVAYGVFHTGYVALLRANGRLELGVELGRVQTGLDPVSEPVRLRVEATGDRLRVFADDRQLIDATDQLWPEGEVALALFGAQATFTEFQLTGQPVSQEELTPVQPDQPTPEAAPPVKPLPRIATRPRAGTLGEFCVKSTGEPFFPDGYNYTVLANNWHATFDTDVYDPAQMEAALAAMEAAGSNCIRVWSWGRATRETSFCGGPESRGLNPGYMANYVDFLRRCTAHHIYVVAMVDEYPRNAYYDWVDRKNTPGEADLAVRGYNRQYLTSGLIAAKAQALRDFITYVKQADPNLLSTVLAWAFCNEAFVNAKLGPFNQDEGEAVCANGKSYDMGNFDQRQACWDEGIVHWANALDAVVKELDPDAMTTVGMWTSDAQRRVPCNGIDATSGVVTDMRFCPRPSVLASPDCNVDFLDIHVYPWRGPDAALFDEVPQEWAALKQLGKPVLVGEYGVFTHQSPDSGPAMQVAVGIREECLAHDYAGFLFWTWNLSGPGCWAGVDPGWADFLKQQFLAVRP